MKKVFRTSPIILAVIILFLAAGCNKEELAKSPVIISEFSSDSIYNQSVKVSDSLEDPAAIDADGNVYTSVTIGKQIWLVENLTTTTYLNGTPILSNLRGSEWTNSTSGAYQISSDIYGNLYNAYAVADERKICPAGWHVPSASEWDELLIYLGGEENAGGPMKESGTSHWLDPNVGATNESGFTALPAGLITEGGWAPGSLFSVGSNAVWWSSSVTERWFWAVYCSYGHTQCFSMQYEMNTGLSVRCIKDSLNPSSTIPFLSTSNITDITNTTGKGGGNITSDGGSPVASRGLCWSTKTKPSTADSKTIDGAGIGQYASSITGLTPGTTYHIRAYATNSAGTRYGEDMTFSTSGVSPNVPTTKPATNVSVTVATLNGIVNAHNFETLVTFEYGTTTDYGQEVTSVQHSVSGDAITNVYAIPTLLKAGTTYHFRIKAENSIGIFYGNEMEFTTLSQAAPSVNSYWATNITYTTATLNGDVNANNLSSLVTFEYGTTTNYGQSVTSEQSPAAGDSIIKVSATITGLGRCGTYHFRIKAENSLGVVYGSDLTFDTQKIPTLIDIPISDITSTTAKSGGIITDEGCSDITESGVVWAQNPRGVFYGGPHRTNDGAGTGSFTSTLTGLQPSTRYYGRSYAKNNAGIAYGNGFSFTTTESGK
jgi:uncharacterized protein (TIGR02145 family)